MTTLDIKSLITSYNKQQDENEEGESQYFSQSSFEKFMQPFFEMDKPAFLAKYIKVIRCEIESKITENIQFKHFHYLDILPLSNFIRTKGYMFAIYDVIGNNCLAIDGDANTPNPKLFMQEYTRRYNVVKGILENFRVPIYAEEKTLRLFLIRQLFTDKNLDKVLTNKIFIDLVDIKSMAEVIRAVYSNDINSKEEIIKGLHENLKNSIHNKLTEFILDNSDSKTACEIKDGVSLYLGYIAQLRTFIVEINQKNLTETFHENLNTSLLENKLKLSSVIVESLFGIDPIIKKSIRHKKPKVNNEKGNWLNSNVIFLEQLGEVGILIEDEVFFNTLLRNVFIKYSVQFSSKLIKRLYENYTILFNNVVSPRLQAKLDSNKDAKFHATRFIFNNFTNLETRLKELQKHSTDKKKKPVVNYLYCENRQPKGLMLENQLKFDKVKGKQFYKGTFLDKSKEAVNPKQDKHFESKRKFYKNSIFSNYKITLKSNKNVHLILNEMQLIIFTLIGKSKGMGLERLKNIANMPLVLLKHSLSSLVELEILLIKNGTYTVNHFKKEKDKVSLNAFSYDFDYFSQFFSTTLAANANILCNLSNYMSKSISRNGSITVDKALARLENNLDSMDDKEVALKDALEKFKEYFIEDKGVIKFKMQ